MRNMTFSQRIKRQAGFSALDTLITVAVVAVVTSFAIVRISAAQENMRLARSAQVLSGYIEKARLAAIRCHCNTTLQVSGSGTYTVTGPLRSPTSEAQALPLDQNISFQNYSTPTTITFDWRGRPDNDYHLTLANSRGATRNVDLSGGGDIKIDGTANYTYAPTVQAIMPTDLSDAAADSYVTGYANNNSNSNTNVTPPPNPKNHKKPKK